MNEYIKTDEYTIMLVKSKNEIYQFLIDNEDFEKVSKYNWHLSKVRNDERYVYAIAYVDHKKAKLHRYITHCPSNMVVDHINRDTKDNRKSNLKICSSEENLSRRVDVKIRKNEQTKRITGVYKDCNYWRVCFKSLDLGYFKNLKDAIKVREAAEKAFLLALQRFNKN